MLKTTELKIVAGSFFLLLVFGCGSQGSGTAPSNDSPRPNLPSVDTSQESEMRYGQTVQTSSGWDVTIDASHSVETAELTNGWTVEARSE